MCLFEALFIYLNGSFQLPFSILQLVDSLPFYISPALKWCFFRAEHFGLAHYMEVPPRRGGTGEPGKNYENGNENYTGGKRVLSLSFNNKVTTFQINWMQQAVLGLMKCVKSLKAVVGFPKILLILYCTQIIFCIIFFFCGKYKASVCIVTNVRDRS